MGRRIVDDSYTLPKPKAGTIAARIRAAMLANGVRTTRALQELTGINRQTTHRWLLQSADQIDPKLLFVVADALHTSTRWLATGKGPMTQPRILTEDQEFVLELSANLYALHDGSRDLWIKDGIGRLEVATARASKASAYPTKR